MAGRIMRFKHAGTEVHFYDCNVDSYMIFPYYTDNTPIVNMANMFDHAGYFCVTKYPWSSFDKILKKLDKKDY
jgi:hypothetical protein